MTTQRLPHPWFSAYWVAWVLIATPYTLFTQQALVWAAWAACFFLVEGLAALWDTSMRDTLSEVITWAHRKVAKLPFRVDRGWTAAVSALITLIVATTISPFFWFHPVLIPVGLGMGYFQWRWLYDHWIHTPTYG